MSRHDDEDTESNVASDTDCGTLTSFKLELSKNRAKYRRIEEGLLSDNEKEKLNQRRERNKAAAARCRNRRRETISRLEKEANDWEDKVHDLRSDIEKLTKQRDQLEFLLQVHNATCSLINDPLPSQRLDELLSQSLPAPPRAASANHVLTPSSSSLPPLSEGLEIPVTKNGQMLASHSFTENTLKLLILSTSNATAVSRSGDLLAPTSSVTAPAAVKPSSLTLNLNGSQPNEETLNKATSKESSKVGSPPNSSNETNSGKAATKNFTLPLIVTPVTPQADYNGGTADTPLLATNFLLDSVPKFTPNTPLFCASVSSSGLLGTMANTTSSSQMSLSQLKNQLSTGGWTPVFTTSNGLAAPVTFATCTDSLFTPVLDVKNEPFSPPLSSTSTEANSIATTVSAD
ncbi:fos-related antigen 2-like isoform X2 [Symsagittifera roscoffensis]|uniref:fos-related antigen 2-like isoform X2 n=1 Tax=Symsagittifera roscoffensis TaxID=84072 RepID=UPI00307C7A4E